MERQVTPCARLNATGDNCKHRTRNKNRDCGRHRQALPNPAVKILASMPPIPHYASDPRDHTDCPDCWTHYKCDRCREGECPCSLTPEAADAYDELYDALIEHEPISVVREKYEKVLLAGLDERELQELAEELSA